MSEIEFKLNILDIVAIVIAIVSIIISVVISVYISGVHDNTKKTHEHLNGFMCCNSLFHILYFAAINGMAFCREFLFIFGHNVAFIITVM